MNPKNPKCCCIFHWCGSECHACWLERTSGLGVPPRQWLWNLFDEVHFWVFVLFLIFGPGISLGYIIWGRR